MTSVRGGLIYVVYHYSKRASAEGGRISRGGGGGGGGGGGRLANADACVIFACKRSNFADVGEGG